MAHRCTHSAKAASAVLVGVFGAAVIASAAADSVPTAVRVARATAIPLCTNFVDPAGGGAGTAQSPHRTIAAAVTAAKPGAIICVTEGTYAEQLKPGTKPFTLAGGFQHGSRFAVRDSATFVSRAKGNGSGSFLWIKDEGPTAGQLTAIDGFEITGYDQAIVRLFYEPQRFDITNNYIHHNVCKDPSAVGGGFALDNVSGTIKGNVIAHNACSRGGAGFFNDGINKSTLSIENNLVDSNAGTDPGASHGGALYGGANKLRVVGNLVINNSVTQWGGGLWIGAFPEGGQYVHATLSWNVYRGNRAGNKGGGFFCDESASCVSDHEVYEKNCGGNIYLDSGGRDPTIATFDHLTNLDALDVDCKAPGAGIIIDSGDDKADSYTITNAVFRGNAEGRDIVTGCDETCKTGKVKVNVSRSSVQTKYGDAGFKVNFGEGIVAPSAAPAPPVNKASAAAMPANETPQPKVSAAPVDTPIVVAQDDSGPGDKVSAKEAFEAAKELGTIEAWNAFLANYPNGFHAALARAYLKKLGAAAEVPPRAPPAVTPPQAAGSPLERPRAPAPVRAAPAPAAAPPSSEMQEVSTPTFDLPPTDPAKAAIVRGARYMGFPERFNRYYTDPTWRPTKAVFVSQNGGGDGATRDTPMAAKAAVASAKPGTILVFTVGAYSGGLEFTKETSGTYDAPVVAYAERNSDGTGGVTMNCAVGARQTCINLEDADYVAVDGFEMTGGKYGVRVVGADFTASRHSRGIAVLGNTGHDQNRDPFFSGQSDWAVWERNVAYGAGKGDGHGIYLSNGGDWNVVRFNETFDNVSSDFQINADPNATCKEVGVPFADPRCDAYAGTGEGGQGASDYFLVDSNFFHDGKGPGANFTSVRRSVVRNNIFGPQARHNVSFWQETDNPKLGSSDNAIVHNLFFTRSRPAAQFNTNSTRNVFANNLLVGLEPGATLLEVDGTAGENHYRSNLYAGGKLDGRTPNAGETLLPSFAPAWFARFPSGAVSHDPNDYAPAAGAPFLGKGELTTHAPTDRNDAPRSGRVAVGPIEGR